MCTFHTIPFNFNFHGFAFCFFHSKFAHKFVIQPFHLNGRQIYKKLPIPLQSYCVSCFAIFYLIMMQPTFYSFL